MQAPIVQLLSKEKGNSSTTFPFYLSHSAQKQLLLFDLLNHFVSNSQNKTQ